ncbi:MAG: GNAT family N-acetyltransferase [Geminicoccaceae bacterium]
MATDRERWELLWSAYLRFYRARLDPAVTDATWSRLVDPTQQPHGLVAELDGRLVGFAHYLFHRSSWQAEESCYFEDLFVAEDVRGSGIARRLMQAVFDAAEAAGAAKVYWLTQQFNAPGRALYDTLGRLTSFVVYER